MLKQGSLDTTSTYYAQSRKNDNPNQPSNHVSLTGNNSHVMIPRLLSSIYMFHVLRYEGSTEDGKKSNSYAQFTSQTSWHYCEWGN